ncbi:MAG TPA: hypothetical protein VHA56_13880 [Mucilaginibacter sp.]|nr:hypothetical protein [Mucilaginibacter sp.]
MQKPYYAIVLLTVLFFGCKKSETKKQGTGTTKTYTITASPGANGTIDPTGTKTVDAGSNVSFFITPANNYGIEWLAVDSKYVPVADSYTFTNVQANHTINASFAPLVKISATTDGNGTVSYSPAHVVSGQTVTFTFKPKPNYVTDSLFVNDKFLKQLAGGTTFTVNSVGQQENIAVTFSITPRGIDSLKNLFKNLLVGSWHYVQYDYRYDGTTKWIIAPYLTDCEKPRHEVYTADNKYTYYLGGTSCDPSYAPTNIYFDGTWQFDASAKHILIAGNQYSDAINHEYVTGSFSLEKLTMDSLVISYPVPGKNFSYRYHYTHK